MQVESPSWRLGGLIVRSSKKRRLVRRVDSGTETSSVDESGDGGPSALSVSIPPVPPPRLNPFLPAPSPMSGMGGAEGGGPGAGSATGGAGAGGATSSGTAFCGTPRDQVMGSATSAEASGSTPLPSVPGPVRLTRRPSLAQTLMGRSQSRRGRGRGRASVEEISSTNRYHSDFEELRLIDSGSFGVVTKVRKRFDGCIYAVKRTRHRLGSKPAGGARVALTDVLKEVFALASLDVCPHVVRYFNAWIEDGYGYIQMEFCDYSLSKLMKSMKSEPVAADTVLRIARHVGLGIAHLHRSGLVHLDIKPSNIFAKKSRGGEMIYKLGDMGLACLTTAVKGVQIEEGDVRYLAPEIFAGEHSQLPKADVFSLGASLLALSIQRELAGNGPEWHALRGRGFDMRAALPARFTDAFAAFLLAMTVPEASERRDIAMVLADPLLRSDSELDLEREREKNAVLKDRLVEAEKRLLASAGEGEHSADGKPASTFHGRLQRAHTL